MEQAIISWASDLVAKHPGFVNVLIVIVALDNFVLKPLKNAFKLNIPDNVFDGVGDIINKIIEKVKSPK